MRTIYLCTFQSLKVIFHLDPLTEWSSSFHLHSKLISVANNSWSPNRITVYNEVMGPNRLKFGISFQNFKVILLAFTIRWPKKITWPCLNFRRMRKCNLTMCLEREENQKNYEVLMVTELRFKKKKKILSPGILDSSSTNRVHIKL